MAIEIEHEEFITCMKLIHKRFDALDNKVDRLSYVKEGINGEQWLDNQDVMLITKLSESTLQRYRSQGKLPYKLDKGEGKCLYKASDIAEFLNSRSNINHKNNH